MLALNLLIESRLDSSEALMDKALKQRLVGAIVLIALAVIVLPMIFGGRPSDGGTGPSEISLPAEPPDLEFETRRFPIGDQPIPEPDDSLPDQRQPPIVPQPENSAGTNLQADAPIDSETELAQEPPPLQTAQTESTQSAAPESDPDVEREVEPGTGGGDAEPPQDAIGQLLQAQAAQPVEETSAQPESSPDSSDSLRYVVQVASFGSTQNATRLAGQLEDAGYAVLLDHVSSDTARLNRVRVGPYGSEAAAQSVSRELRDRFSGINPRIVDLEPEKTSPVVASSDPLVRWVVQVGSFGSSENASNLVSRLQASGLTAYDETVTTDTSTIYRVRVGPFLDREEALGVEQRIGNEMGIDGVVMSAN
ncbi:MAG TPA: SPOR domain-containing protein [Xanthomonadales bacterium]|nr:SPOR domain-containing protein [Xanthomonadales bacterium]